MASIVIAPFTGVAKLFGLGPTELPAQRLGEIAQQTAKEGEPRQIVFGIVRPIGGNIVAVQEPPRIQRKKQSSGGKGGGGSEQTVEVPRRTYAVGICEGPVTGIRRAWRNNKLIYDGRPNSEWGRKNNGTFLRRFTFYLGEWDQLPDPSLEAVFGAGQVPAMRGTCYMVARDEDLQDTGGAVPQWIFEVERAYGESLTSKPYAVELDDSINAEPQALRISEFRAQIDNLDVGASVTSLDLIAYEPPSFSYQEDVDVGALVQALELVAELPPEYELQEGVDVAVSVTGLQLKLIARRYTLDPDGLDIGASITGLTLA